MPQKGPKENVLEVEIKKIGISGTDIMTKISKSGGIGKERETSMIVWILKMLLMHREAFDYWDSIGRPKVK